MNESPVRISVGARRAMVALLAVATLTLASCGASSTAVKAVDTTAAKADTTTTVEESSTTVEETTTTVEETTTTDAPATTAATGSSGDEWPTAAKESFMKSCSGGGDSAMVPICECVLRGAQDKISVADLMDIGTKGSLPSDVQAIITDFAKKCAVDPNAY